MRVQSRPKLAILYGPLLDYRVALFNKLCERYDVTVFAFSFDGPRDALHFKLEVMSPRNMWRFRIQPGLRKRLKRGRFDACIAFLDVAYLSVLTSIFFPVSPRTIAWGPWITENDVANRLRLAAIARSDAAVFYSHRHLQDFAARGAQLEKLYVAHNTVAVTEAARFETEVVRDCILFVGSFAPRKGLDRLVRIFAGLLTRLPERTQLVLVGDGAERDSLQRLVAELAVQNRVEMPGWVKDDAVLASYYARAFIAVSLNQAGLSVLQSMGFGVPFMTTKESVSGGEKLNIVNGVNGFIVDNTDTAIAETLAVCANDSQRMTAMGAAARDHYVRYATIDNYAQGFYDALEGTRKAAVWQGRDRSE